MLCKMFLFSKVLLSLQVGARSSVFVLLKVFFKGKLNVGHDSLEGLCLQTATAQSRGSTEKQCHETRAPGRLNGVASASTLSHNVKTAIANPMFPHLSVNIAT